MERTKRILAPERVNQLHLLKESLRTDPRFDLVRYHLVHRTLRQEAHKKSAAIEENRSKAKAHRRLESAYEFFMNRYSGVMDIRFLMDTIRIILGSERIIPLRSCTARASGMGFEYPEDVSAQLEQFCRWDTQITEPIQKALYTHLHLARIHPFYDGNGRLARLIQNCILNKDGFPPIIIGEEDRAVYMTLINHAQREYRDTRGDLRDRNYLSLDEERKLLERWKDDNAFLGAKQRAFYEFLAEKLYKTLEESKKRVLKISKSQPKTSSFASQLLR
jgi:hypothetical protein